MTVSVWLADGSTYRHEETVDLEDLNYLTDDVAIGFSAAMGTLSETHQLLSWSFNKTDVECNKNFFSFAAGFSFVTSILWIITVAHTSCLD